MTCSMNQNFNLYKGTDFFIEFRRYESAGGNIIPAADYSYKFRAAAAPGGTEIIEYQSGESPAYITFDDENIVTIHIPADETGDITQASLYYEIDIVAQDGTIERIMSGTIRVHQSIAEPA